MPLTRFTSLAAMACIIAACGDTAPEQTDADAAAELSPEQIAELSPEEIAALAEQFPRLGDEPLPEPEPSADAQPERVPPRLAQRLTDGALETITGSATYYANSFEGRRTASGIPFRQNQLVAAHRGYPFGTILRVTNTGNDRSVNVRVVDRGPFGASAARGTVIDLSRRAADTLGFVSAGRAQVRVEVLEWGRGVATS